jgi:copper transport protein
MRTLIHSAIAQKIFLIALLAAFFLTLLFPVAANAQAKHAILLRSEPPKDSILNVAPHNVRMWFSEDLNPSFSTAVVVNAQNHRVDNGDAHVSAGDPREMDLTLKPNLSPAVYIVIWRSDSNEDGHILRGSFIFTVARPDGSIPTLNGNTVPGQNVLVSGNLSGLYTGQIDGPTLFNIFMVTLVELGAVFWVGAQAWLVFVLLPVTEDHEELSEINRQVQRRFERRFSLPTLLVLLLANIGVLLGQALNLTGGQWGPAVAPTLLAGLAASGQFGTFWIMREVVIVLAFGLALYILLSTRRPHFASKVLPWANLALGLALFIAITMSGHAAAVNKSQLIYAVPLDWLHLLAAALWVGGMMYISTTYLPVLLRSPVAERARSLVTTLPYYSPWAVAAVVLMAITGPFNATFHLTSWNQFITTAYGRALVVKILLVGALMLTSAVHVGLLRPRLKKEFKKYAYVQGRISSSSADAKPDRAIKLITQQVKLREGRLTTGTHRLIRVLRWEPLLGVGVLVCVGLMNAFAGTLSPVAPAQQAPANTKPFNTTVKTSDKKFTITFNVNPNHFGTNIFTVSVVDTSTGKPTTNVGVSLYTTMLDMDMGTDTVNLLPDGKGHFSASGDLSMSGRWQIRIQIRTPNNTLHEARVDFFVPS